MTRIKLPLITRKEPFGPLTEWCVVDAELLHDIAPHISLGTFAVHRKQGWTGPTSAWGITNIETGQAVGYLYDTRAQAIRDARRILSTKSDADMRKAYRKAPKECRA